MPFVRKPKERWIPTVGNFALPLGNAFRANGFITRITTILYLKKILLSPSPTTILHACYVRLPFDPVVTWLPIKILILVFLPFLVLHFLHHESRRKQIPKRAKLGLLFGFSIGGRNVRQCYGRCSSGPLTRWTHTTSHEAALVLAASWLNLGERWINSLCAPLRETEAQFCAFFGELIPDVAGTIG